MLGIEAAVVVLREYLASLGVPTVVGAGASSLSIVKLDSRRRSIPWCSSPPPSCCTTRLQRTCPERTVHLPRAEAEFNGF
jgi:hypothetical protein